MMKGDHEQLHVCVCVRVCVCVACVCVCVCMESWYAVYRCVYVHCGYIMYMCEHIYFACNIQCVIFCVQTLSRLQINMTLMYWKKVHTCFSVH